ncbi:MAG: gfo/Idh/MocA family oxidoreductase, partial [Cyclobacteriaceae bacterium]
HQKAHELYKSGAIGDLVMIDAAYDRHSTLGAWQYSIPPDASPDNIDWQRFLGDAPKVPFDPVRFFRWRNYQDYGTGITGDLYVHLISWINNIIKSNGPDTIYSSGGLRYWKDGRNVPDIMVSVMDYPDAANHPPFNLTIRVNFVAGGETENGLRFVGSEGSMILRGNSLVVSKTPLPKKPEYGGYDSLFTFPENTQKDFIQNYNAKYYTVSEHIREPKEVTYQAPDGYDDRYDHWVNLIAAMREGTPILEDASFGLRAAAPSLSANISHFENRVVKWDPDRMKLK